MCRLNWLKYKKMSGKNLLYLKRFADKIYCIKKMCGKSLFKNLYRSAEKVYLIFRINVRIKFISFLKKICG